MLYRRIQPTSVAILKQIGQLSAEEKQDYDTAVDCYTRALRMQEQVSANPSLLHGREACFHAC